MMEARPPLASEVFQRATTNPEKDAGKSREQEIRQECAEAWTATRTNHKQNALVSVATYNSVKDL